jgi:GNAT superfamily N-acetyltransferase
VTDLDRCLAFLREHAYRISTPGESGRFGTALLFPELPNVWSINYVVAERDLDAATAEALAAEADHLLGRPGLTHRKVEVWDETAGARLADEFRTLGWHVEHDLVFVHRRPPDRAPDLSSVEEVDVETLLPAWKAGISPDFAGKQDVVRQLAEHKRVLAADGARFFAARVDGAIASYCDLYLDEDTAQIESVMTLERFRNRGLARAVVMAALEAARAGGHDLVFLLADDADWPKALYEKLGFDRLGSIYEFTLRSGSPN